MENLQVTFNNVDTDKPLTVSLAGKLCSQNANNFMGDLMNIIKSLNKDCYIDITSLENIDSNGRNALLFAQRNLEVSGNKLYILSTGANPLNRVLQVAPSLQEARA